MGLFDRAKSEPATGKALVHAVTVPKEPAALYHRIRLVLQVHLDGRAPYAAKVTTFAPHHKIPENGDWLPVAVDPRNARRVRVVWDEVAATGSEGPHVPEARPAALDDVAPPLPTAIVGSVPSVAAPVASIPAAPAADVVEALERLVRLRDEGAISDEEFTMAKQRLLADPATSA